jgi:hypothetical protein
MPARQKTCLKPTSAVKAQVVPYDGIAIIYNRNVDDNLKWVFFCARCHVVGEEEADG